MAFSCPDCDTNAPDYGSSYHNERQDSGHDYSGDGRGTPGDYWTRESNIQRDNREHAYEQQRWEERRDTWQENARNNGGDRCRGPMVADSVLKTCRNLSSLTP
jgi:hypothetical protein